jgi:hypothetical protein
VKYHSEWARRIAIAVGPDPLKIHAARLGITEQYLGKLLTKQIDAVSPRLLARVEDVFGIPYRLLLKPPVTNTATSETPVSTESVTLDMAPSKLHA